MLHFEAMEYLKQLFVVENVWWCLSIVAVLFVALALLVLFCRVRIAFACRYYPSCLQVRC